MTLYEFTPPTQQSLAWDQTSPLYRHYGTLPVGITIYRDDDGWHELGEGYEEEILANAEVIYRGGRVYMVTEDEYFELYIAGYITEFIDGLYPGGYPGLSIYPAPEVVTPPGDDEFLPGPDALPGPDLLPGG